MWEEIKNLNETVLHQMATTTVAGDKQQKQVRRKQEFADEEEEGSHLTAVHRYLATYDATKLDKYFSIKPTGVNQYMMGDRKVLVDKHSNIFVGGVKYGCTPGLWRLIMMKTPESYTQGDLLNYRKLIHQTNAMTHTRNVVEGQSRPIATYKWRNILEHFYMKKLKYQKKTMLTMSVCLQMVKEFNSYQVI